MLFRHIYSFFLTALLLSPTFLFSQGGGFRMSIDPEKMWNWISKGKDSINLDELDPFSKGSVEKIMTQYGVTSRTVTKQQYVEVYTKFNEDMKAGKIDFKSMFSPPARKEGSGGFGGGGFGGGSGEFKGFGKEDKKGWEKKEEKKDEKKDEKKEEKKRNERAQFIEWRFKTYDKDADGLLSHDEISASENLAPLLNDKSKFDKNSDGFISLEEYTTYVEAIIEAKQKDREQARSESGSSRSSSSGETPKPSEGGSSEKTVITEFDKPKPAEEEKRATVQRAGKLPPGLPDWFATIDGKGDNDGQIGLYEWRAYSGKPLDEFFTMDLNNDGFITPSEYFRFKGLADTTVVRSKPLEDPALANSKGSTASTGFNRFGTGGTTASSNNDSRTPSSNGWGFGGNSSGDASPFARGGFGGMGKSRDRGDRSSSGMGNPPSTPSSSSGTTGMSERPFGKGGFGNFGRDPGMGSTGGTERPKGKGSRG